MRMSDATVLEHIQYTKAQHDLFRSGPLFETWATAYPMLFDDIDLALARSQARLGRHFVEWLAAIHLFHTRGWISLQAKYLYKKHKAKRAIVEGLVSSEAMDFFNSLKPAEYYQSPDLFSYTPSTGEWRFVEVKNRRSSDKLRQSQIAFFDRVLEATGAELHLVTLGKLRV